MSNSKQGQMKVTVSPKTENANSQTFSEEKYINFFNTLLIPSLIEDPQEEENQSFFNIMLSTSKVKYIREAPSYVQIQIGKRHIPEPSMTEGNSFGSFKFSDPEVQNQLEKVNKYLVTQFPFVYDKLTKNPLYNPETQLHDCLLKMKQKNYLIWYSPLQQSGPNLKLLVLSKKLLSILGYELHEVALEFQSYKSFAFDLLNSQTYKTNFMMYITTLRKFISMELNGDINHEDIIKESERTVFNEFIGRNNIKIKTEMKVTMPSMCLFCFEILRVVDQNKIKSGRRELCRNILTENAEKTIYNSLHKIAMLPQSANPKNSSKVCKYIQLRENVVKQEENEPIQIDDAVILPSSGNST